MTEQCYRQQVARALALYEKAGIVLTDAEKQNVEIADFGLNQVETIGLQLVTYVNTERVCAKEMVLFPGQSCPEHIHVTSYGKEGKDSILSDQIDITWKGKNITVKGETEQNIIFDFIQ